MNQITKILVQDINSGKENLFHKETPTKCIANKKCYSTKNSDSNGLVSVK